MNNFPFYRNLYNNYYNQNYNYMLNKYNHNNPNVSNYYNYENSIKEERKTYSSQNRIKKEHFKNQEKEPIFRLFGFHLFLDDLVILGLLFFLYNEGVKDEFLYISLILLLLS